MKFRFIILMIVLLTSRSQAQDIEILSKADAKAMFGMTRTQWTLNVQGVAAAGQARGSGSTATGLAMEIKTSEGQLTVKPNYRNNDQQPESIDVSVTYTNPTTLGLLTDANLKSATDAAKIQLAPEFSVSGKSERTKDGLTVFFHITEKK